MASPTPSPPAPPAPTSDQVRALVASKQFVVLLILAGIVGFVVSLAAWGFLELTYQIQQGVYVHLPTDFGYHHGPPDWWALPFLLASGVVTALACTRLPGDGGHIPAEGLKTDGGPTPPFDLVGIMLAATATIGLGVVLGPEAPLIALGSGLGVLAIKLLRRDLPPTVPMVIAAAGSFAAVSFIFGSPLIAAVILIEATGLGGPMVPLVLVPGLLAAGIGSLVSIGMGQLTGLSTSAFAIGAVHLPQFPRPDIAEFAWAIALAVVIAVVTAVVIRGGLLTLRIARPRMLLVLPVVGLLIGVLAILFHVTSGKDAQEVLFSGQSALPGLISGAGTWSLSALALLIVFKGVAYSMSLGSFRGGPTFPGMFLGAAAGIMASHLPGLPITPAVGVGIGVATVSVLRLPLSAVVIATLLTIKSGAGSEPLIIVGVVVGYVVTMVLAQVRPAGTDAGAGAAPAAAAGSGAGAGAAAEAAPAAAPGGGAPAAG